MPGIVDLLGKAARNPAAIPWLAGHRVATHASYGFGPFMKDWAFPPETVNIYPTTRCNLKCSMCFERFYQCGAQLDLQDWLAVIGDLRKFRPRVHLSGGEPLIYDNIIELIAAIKKKGLFLHITTNGVLLEDYAADLIRLKVDRIDVSIDGPQEVHDRVRGVKGTYAAVLRGFRKLRELKESGKLPALKFNSIINLETPETMRDIISLAKEFSAGTVQFIHPLFLDGVSVERHRSFLKRHLGLDANYWLAACRFKPAVRDINAVARVLNELCSENPGMVEVFPRFDMRQVESYYGDSVRFQGTYRGDCRAMWHTLTILPDGKMESCPDYVIGSCRRSRLTRIWNGAAMRGLRRRMRKKDFFPVCRACCFFYQ